MSNVRRISRQYLRADVPEIFVHGPDENITTSLSDITDLGLYGSNKDFRSSCPDLNGTTLTGITSGSVTCYDSDTSNDSLESGSYDNKERRATTEIMTRPVYFRQTSLPAENRQRRSNRRNRRRFDRGLLYKFAEFLEKTSINTPCPSKKPKKKEVTPTEILRDRFKIQAASMHNLFSQNARHKLDFYDGNYHTIHSTNSPTSIIGFNWPSSKKSKSSSNCQHQRPPSSTVYCKGHCCHHSHSHHIAELPFAQQHCNCHSSATSQYEKIEVSKALMKCCCGRTDYETVLPLGQYLDVYHKNTMVRL